MGHGDLHKRDPDRYDENDVEYPVFGPAVSAKPLVPIFYLYKFKTEQNYRIFKDALEEKDDPALWTPIYSKEDLHKVTSTLEAYQTALEHIANGHPNPAAFARTLLNIGKEG